MIALLLTFLQESATAPATTPEGGATGSSPMSTVMQFLPMIAIFAIFYFVLIGPERKNRKKREAMLESMKKGDKVMTSAGMYGTIVAMQDKVVTLQLDEGVRVRFSRAAIQEVLPDDAA
ncbi:MAG: preprotein translocase subunit YajC [Planctomycetota bacterium]|nr:preprotein translocase subunit YajC [Planctomycetota bacterium]